MWDKIKVIRNAVKSAAITTAYDIRVVTFAPILSAPNPSRILKVNLKVLEAKAELLFVLH